MARIFVTHNHIRDDRLFIDGEQAHYLNRVMRLGVDDTVVALDNSGQCYDAVIQSVEKQRMTARITARRMIADPPVPITLYQALPKADKLEWIIQKATELGVSRIVPVQAARSVVQVKGDRLDNKLRRWQKVAQEAAEQSERGRIPEVVEPVTLKDVTLEAGFRGLVLAERAEGLTFLQVLSPAPAGLALCIGPEGGWAPYELETFEQLGFQAVTLGARILRTETAALAALAIASAVYELG